MRRRLLAEMAPGKTWPENPGGSGGSGTPAVDPYTWIRWENRGLADVIMSIEGAIEAPGGVPNPRQYWDRIPAGETNVRNIGKPPATELHLMNVDAVNTALVWIEIDTEPIVDLGNTRILLDPSRKPIGGGGSGAPIPIRIQDATTNITEQLVADNELRFGGDTSLEVFPLTQVFDGSVWKRLRMASAANLINQSGLGAALVAPPGMWSVISQPATGVQASGSRAAGGAGVRHILTGWLISLTENTAPTASISRANVRDGATGAGTIIDGGAMGAAATVGNAAALGQSGLATPGTAATAMTAESDAAVAGTIQGAVVRGFDAS